MRRSGCVPERRGGRDLRPVPHLDRPKDGTHARATRSLRLEQLRPARRRAVALGRSPRPDPGPPRDRPASSTATTTNPPPSGRSSSRASWIACGLAFSGRGARAVRRQGVRRVPERLRDREVAQRRQRVRVGGDLLDVRDPAPLPAPRAVLGHLRRAGAACHLHLRRHRAHRAVLVAAPGVRCAADRLGHQGRAPQGRRGRARSRPRGEAAAAIPPRAQGARRASTSSITRRRASGWPRRCSPRSWWSRSPT